MEYADSRAALVAQMGKNLHPMQETWVQSLRRKNPLEKETAIYSSILAWKISWTEGPGGLQSMGLQRVGQDWVTNTHMSTHLTLFKIEQHKSHYQASFRHSWTRKLRKTASLLSKKRHAVQTRQSWVLLWTKIEMNPPPFPAFCPLKLNTRLKPPFQCKCHSMSLVPFFSWKVNKNSLFSSC